MLSLWLALAHGVADAASGWLLGVAAQTQEPAAIGILLLVYNGLAFAAQPLAGLVVDRGRLSAPIVAAMSLAAIAAALLVNGASPLAAAAFAGLGSAFFHVSGGAVALAVPRGRATAAGVFSAPGVLGLAVGGVLAIAALPAGVPLAATLGVLAAIVALVGVRGAEGGAAKAEALALRTNALALRTNGSSLRTNGLAHRPQRDGVATQLRDARVTFDRHDLVMLALLAAIALRSFVWTLLQMLEAQQTELLFVLAVAAAAGKLCGGWLADRLGWRLWSLMALAAATPLISAGAGRPVLFAAGVWCLQSTMPVMLAMAGQLLPRAPATAAGLALGLGVAIGGAPLVAGLPVADVAWTAPLAIVCAACAVFIALRGGPKLATGEVRLNTSHPEKGGPPKADPAIVLNPAIALRRASWLTLLVLVCPAAAGADVIPGPGRPPVCMRVTNLDRFPDIVLVGYTFLPQTPDVPRRIFTVDAAAPQCSPREDFAFFRVARASFNADAFARQGAAYFSSTSGLVRADVRLQSPVKLLGRVRGMLDMLTITAADGKRLAIVKTSVVYTYDGGASEELPYRDQNVRPEATGRGTKPSQQMLADMSLGPLSGQSRVPLPLLVLLLVVGATIGIYLRRR